MPSLEEQYPKMFHNGKWCLLVPATELGDVFLRDQQWREAVNGLVIEKRNRELGYIGRDMTKINEAGIQTGFNYCVDELNRQKAKILEVMK